MKTLFGTLELCCAMFLTLPIAAGGTLPLTENTANPADTLISDEFNSPNLNGSIWRFINPLGDASYAMTGTQLSVSVPESTSHDITEEGNFAPLLVQQVQDPQEFEVNVKFDAQMTRTFQMQGVQIRQDSLNFLRIELYSSEVRLIRLAWSFVDGIHFDVGSDTIGTPSVPLFLRIRRVGDTWTQHWSRNGTAYILGTSFTRPLAVSQVGVYGSNAGHPRPSAPAFTGLIDYFRTSRPLPIALAQFSATAVGPATVRLHWRPLSENNNRGFEVQQCRSGQSNFETVPSSFVQRQDTVPTDYVWSHQGVTVGTWRYRLKQLSLDGVVNFTDPVEVFVATSVSESQPHTFDLYQNSPNPFNPTTTIRFAIPNGGETLRATSLQVYDLLGREVATLVNEVKEPGEHSVVFDASALASGVYWYQLKAGSFVKSRKLLLLR